MNTEEPNTITYALMSLISGNDDNLCDMVLIEKINIYSRVVQHIDNPEKLLEIICEISKKELEIDKKILLAENLYYDKLRKEVVDQNDVPIKLTKKELQFLELLIKNRGRIVTLQEIENSIWESENFTHIALRALVKRVRQKTSKELIKNFPGIGYKLVEKR